MESYHRHDLTKSWQKHFIRRIRECVNELEKIHREEHVGILEGFKNDWNFEKIKKYVTFSD
jgi:hypothetical protein